MADLQNFTVYSREGCPYCVKIKEVLELAKDFDRPSFYQQFGEGSTFPQVVLNGDNLGGCTETVQYLKENNLV